MNRAQRRRSRRCNGGPNRAPQITDALLRIGASDRGPVGRFLAELEHGCACDRLQAVIPADGATPDEMRGAVSAFRVDVSEAQVRIHRLPFAVKFVGEPMEALAIVVHRPHCLLVEITSSTEGEPS